MKNEELSEDFIKKASRLLKGETLEKDEKEQYRLHERVIKKYTRLKINVNEKNEQWSIDLAEMKDLARFNKQYRYLLCVVDVYSRYAFVKLLKNKMANNVAQKFEAILLENNEIPQKIQCDEGTEFQKIRKELSKKYGFHVFHTYNREIKASHAERFIQTIKQMIRRFLTVLEQKMGKKTFNYEKYLPIILKRYNESPHKSLFGLSPIDIYRNGKSNDRKKRLKEIFNYNLKKPTKSVLKENTRVRIVRAKNSVFEKSSLRRWTDEIFIIDKVLLYDPVVYELIDLKGEKIKGKFYRRELQVV